MEGAHSTPRGLPGLSFRTEGPCSLLRKQASNSREKTGLDHHTPARCPGPSLGLSRLLSQQVAHPRAAHLPLPFLPVHNNGSQNSPQVWLTSVCHRPHPPAVLDPPLGDKQQPLRHGLLGWRLKEIIPTQKASQEKKEVCCKLFITARNWIQAKFPTRQDQLSKLRHNHSATPVI